MFFLAGGNPAGAFPRRDPSPRHRPRFATGFLLPAEGTQRRKSTSTMRSLCSTKVLSGPDQDNAAVRPRLFQVRHLIGNVCWKVLQLLFLDRMKATIDQTKVKQENGHSMVDNCDRHVLYHTAGLSLNCFDIHNYRARTCQTPLAFCSRPWSTGTTLECEREDMPLPSLFNHKSLPTKR